MFQARKKFGNFSSVRVPEAFKHINLRIGRIGVCIWVSLYLYTQVSLQVKIKSSLARYSLWSLSPALQRESPCPCHDFLLTKSRQECISPEPWFRPWGRVCGSIVKIFYCFLWETSFTSRIVWNVWEVHTSPLTAVHVLGDQCWQCHDVRRSASQ